MITLDRALHPNATRPGLLQPGEVFEVFVKVGGRPLRAEAVAERLDRSLDQVLHVLSYMTSLGLLEARRSEGVWTYGLADLSAVV